MDQYAAAGDETLLRENHKITDDFCSQNPLSTMTYDTTVYMQV